MTPAILAHKIWTTRRGVGALAALLMALIGVLLYLIITASPPRIVEYGSTIIEPDRAGYCPGETMRYPVEIKVNAADLPVILRVVEAWERSDGIVLQSTAVVYEMPLVRPVNLKATASRTIPDLRPGVYWLNHVSENGETKAYTVGPVTVLDCAPE